MASSVAPEERIDTAQWLPSKNLIFSVISAWNILREPSPKLPWTALIWFRWSIPKHSFINWLAYMDRLRTEGTSKYNLQLDTSCEFCGLAESSDHLFFACPYSAQVWKGVRCTLGKSGTAICDWDLFINWSLAALKRNTAINLITKLGISATVYNIWLERNRRLHNGVSSSAHALIMVIMQSLRDRISGILG